MVNNFNDLDDIDIQIIRLLQNNSRRKIADIAREIDELTENAIKYRIEKLEDGGFISNYTIRLNPKMFGKEIMAILDINVLPENINSTLKYLRSLENITDVYLTTGRYPITIIGHFNDSSSVTHFITNDLKKVKILDYEVATVLQREKREFFGI
jgi:DNA-binding Lrp family transcriptional regulator